MAPPVRGSKHPITAYYSFIDLERMKRERLSWPSWLICSGRFTHISGHPSAEGRARDRESSLAEDRRSTTVTLWYHSQYYTKPTKSHNDFAALHVALCRSQWSSGNMPGYGEREPLPHYPGSNHTAGICIYHDSHCDIQPWALAAHPIYCSA